MQLGVIKLAVHFLDYQRKLNNELMLYPRQRHNYYSPPYSFVANTKYPEENNKSLFTELHLKKYENKALLYELLLL